MCVYVCMFVCVCALVLVRIPRSEVTTACVAEAFHALSSGVASLCEHVCLRRCHAAEAIICRPSLLTMSLAADERRLHHLSAERRL